MKKHALGLMAAMALGACGTGNGTGVGSTTPADQNTIIGGFDVTGKNLDAVGSLAIVDPRDGSHFSICTATLIAPHTIITAKHCTQESDPLTGATVKLIDLYDMAFDIGNDSNAARSFTLVDADVSPVANSGALGLGSDVAVYHLHAAVTDVAPFTVINGGPTADLVGQKATAIGYGVQSTGENVGAVPDNNLRKAGSTTITALSGNFLQLALGLDFAGYLADLAATYGQDAVDACMADAGCAASLHASYDANSLNPGYEFWVSRQAGDVLTCFGDSGGPLLKKVDGKLQILGLVSYGTGSETLPCDFGGVYSAIGPKTDKFIADSLNWTDACGEVSVAGSCAGNVVTRCSGKGEGHRAIQSYDCGLVDQTCQVLPSGRAGCADGASPTPGSNVSSQLAPQAVAAAVFASTREKNSPARKQAAQALAKFKK